MDGWMDRWMDGWMDGYMAYIHIYIHRYIDIYILYEFTNSLSFHHIKEMNSCEPGWKDIYFPRMHYLCITNVL